MTTTIPESVAFTATDLKINFSSAEKILADTQQYLYYLYIHLVEKEKQRQSVPFLKIEHPNENERVLLNLLYYHFLRKNYLYDTKLNTVLTLQRSSLTPEVSSLVLYLENRSLLLEFLQQLNSISSLSFFSLSLNNSNFRETLNWDKTYYKIILFWLNSSRKNLFPWINGISDLGNILGNLFPEKSLCDLELHAKWLNIYSLLNLRSEFLKLIQNFTKTLQFILKEWKLKYRIGKREEKGFIAKYSGSSLKSSVLRTPKRGLLSLGTLDANKLPLLRRMTTSRTTINSLNPSDKKHQKTFWDGLTDSTSSDNMFTEYFHLYERIIRTFSNLGLQYDSALSKPVFAESALKKGCLICIETMVVALRIGLKSSFEFLNINFLPSKWDKLENSLKTYLPSLLASSLKLANAYSTRVSRDDILQKLAETRSHWQMLIDTFDHHPAVFRFYSPDIRTKSKTINSISFYTGLSYIITYMKFFLDLIDPLVVLEDQDQVDISTIAIEIPKKDTARKPDNPSPATIYESTLRLFAKQKLMATNMENVHNVLTRWAKWIASTREHPIIKDAFFLHSKAPPTSSTYSIFSYNQEFSKFQEELTTTNYFNVVSDYILSVITRYVLMTRNDILTQLATIKNFRHIYLEK